MSSLGPLPPIDEKSTLPKRGERPAAEQQAIEADLKSLHIELGVKPGCALQEAMTPELRVPYEKLMSAAAPPMASAPVELSPAPAASAPTLQAAPAVVLDEDQVSNPTSGPETGLTLPQLLALPAPEDASSAITLDVSTGQSVTLDRLGPVVVNTNGTLSRITNWHQMGEQEQKLVQRRIAKRNVDRLKVFRDQGDLKADLVSALSETDAGQ